MKNKKGHVHKTHLSNLLKEMLKELQLELHSRDHRVG